MERGCVDRQKARVRRGDWNQSGDRSKGGRRGRKGVEVLICGSSNDGTTT